jgi:integrase/recombinase XerD
LVFVPCLVRASVGDGQVPRLGHPLLDDYLDMVAARARPNTVLASAFDLKVFFSVVGKEPAEIGHADVLAFIQAQRATATRGDGGADRGRRGGPVRAHHQASTGLGHRATTT